MPTYKKKSNFFETPAGLKARQELSAMVADTGFHTVSYYSANTDRHPDNRMTFVEKHMEYLRAHPSTDPDHYLANLRLMTRTNRG
jgi:hypothetical protein